VYTLIFLVKFGAISCPVSLLVLSKKACWGGTTLKRRFWVFLAVFLTQGLTKYRFRYKIFIDRNQLTQYQHGKVFIMTFIRHYVLCQSEPILSLDRYFVQTPTPHKDHKKYFKSCIQFFYKYQKIRI